MKFDQQLLDINVQSPLLAERKEKTLRIYTISANSIKLYFHHRIFDIETKNLDTSNTLQVTTQRHNASVSLSCVAFH